MAEMKTGTRYFLGVLTTIVTLSFPHVSGQGTVFEGVAEFQAVHIFYNFYRKHVRNSST